MKKIIALAIAATLALSLLPSCASKASSSGSKPITACIGTEPGSIDPALNQEADGATYISHAFEGLTKVDKNFNIVPGIAESLPTVSSDGLTYTYKIRSDAKWSDGKPVKAQDFVYSWQRDVNPATASQYAYQLYYIKNAEDINSQFVGTDGKPAKAKVDAAGKFVKDAKGNYIADPNGKYVAAKEDGTPLWLDDLGVKATDDHTLVVTLAAPCPYFGQITAFPTLFPVRQDIVDANPTKWATDPKTYVSDGPYILKSWTHNSKMVFTKNPYYYNSKDNPTNEIDFLLMSENSAALAAFKNGKLDIVQNMIPAEELQSLIKQKQAVVQPQLGNNYITLNVKKAPFDNLNVRLALAYALDRSYIVNSIMKNGAVAAGAFVPFGINDAKSGTDYRKVGGNYIDPSASAYKTNVEKAKKYLSDAGYPDGKNFPEIEYKYNVGASNEQVAEYIANAWKTNLGISVKLTKEDFPVLITDRNNGNYESARDAWSADYNDPMTFLDMCTTTSGNNDSHFSNADYDKLVAEAKSTGDQTVRMKDMHKAEDILMANMPVIPLSFRSDPLLVGKKITGYKDSPLGYLYLMWASKK